MFLPDWIYRLLPFAYVAAGLVIVSTMDAPVGAASGVLLVLAGLIIWKMRVDYRREIRREIFETKDPAKRAKIAGTGTSR